jgi:hypothetical protein
MLREIAIQKNPPRSKSYSELIDAILYAVFKKEGLKGVRRFSGISLIDGRKESDKWIEFT